LETDTASIGEYGGFNASGIMARIPWLRLFGLEWMAAEDRVQEEALSRPLKVLKRWASVLQTGCPAGAEGFMGQQQERPRAELRLVLRH